MTPSKDKSFIFYHDFKYILGFLNQEQKGDLLDALILYSENKEIPMPFSGAVQNAFMYIKNRIDDNEKKREILRENAKKGGNPNFKKGTSNPYYDNQKITKKPPKDNQKITKTLLADNLNINAKAKVNANANLNKNVKDNKTTLLSFIEKPDFKQLVERWLAYKKERKQAYKGAISIKAMYNNLINLSGGNIDTATKIIDVAISNNWAGFFQLKNSYSENSNNSVPAKPGKYANVETLECKN